MEWAAFNHETQGSGTEQMKASGIFYLLIFVAALTGSVQADIFEWEWVDPNNPQQGKRQSSTLVPDGTGVNAAPGAMLAGRNLTGAYLLYENLRDANAAGTVLTDADLERADLENASFAGATLSGTNLKGAFLWGADFSNTTSKGFTSAQFYLHETRQRNEGAFPGINFSDNNLDGWILESIKLRDAKFSRSSLRGANFWYSSLVNAKLDHTDLTGANFNEAGLSNADFTGATINHVNFLSSVGFTLEQLYSTASYQAKDLSQIAFGTMNFSGANFAGQNLSKSNFSNALLTGADLTNADIRGASFWVQYPEVLPPRGLTAQQLYSTASYQSGDLNGVSLTSRSFSGWSFAGKNLSNAHLSADTAVNANFAQANLTNAIFGANLTGANFEGSTIRGANITAMSAAQLYSTASYQAKDLRGVQIGGIDISGWNFEGQNLERAYFFKGWDPPILSGVNFRNANLKNAILSDVVQCSAADFSHANLANAWLSVSFSGANLTGVDARGAVDGNFAGATTTNLIRPDGHIDGLDLTGGQFLVIRDHDNDPGRTNRYGYPAPQVSIAVTVNERFAMDASGTMQLVFGSNEWNSLISFLPEIPVEFNRGNLDLEFASDVSLATQIGRTIRVFDWTGVTPTGAFNVVSPYEWDLSNLYTTGEVTLLGAGLTPGDFDGDGDVDGLDFVAWQANFPIASGATMSQGDADGDGDVDGADFVVWQTNFPFGSVPEPSAVVLALCSLSILGCAMSRRRR
jgi:uncharacterized protein YjbI with pentapeptide repeats